MAVLETFNPTRTAVEREIEKQLDASDPERSEMGAGYRVIAAEYARSDFDPDSAVPRLDIFHNFFASQPTLERGALLAPHDREWDAEGGGYRVVALGDRYASEVELPG